MYDGVLIINKEQGFTSFDVVAKLRGILQMKKIGHTGTLDPMATGVLCVCAGRATKAVEILTEHDKTYEATVLLGTTTDTGDITGNTLTKTPVDPSITKEKIEEICSCFVGDILQVPPMYSALKVDGQKLCDLARKGKEVERKPRPVVIHSIEVNDLKLPEFKMTVSCGKGTYIRTLAEDIGSKIGCGATLSSLKRTRVDRFGIDKAYALEELEKLKAEGRLHEAVIPVEKCLSGKKITIPRELDFALKNGAKLDLSDYDNKALGLFGEEVFEEGERVLVYDFEGTFIGTYIYKNRLFKVDKMFYLREA